MEDGSIKLFERGLFFYAKSKKFVVFFRKTCEFNIFFVPLQPIWMQRRYARMRTQVKMH